MPFTVEQKYILETEDELSIRFPSIYVTRMMESNGGESNSGEFELYPFFDKSDKKRISRTCNHIGLETNNARTMDHFPGEAVAIGADGFGNFVVLIPEMKGQLEETIYFWDHETGVLEVIGSNINEI